MIELNKIYNMNCLDGLKLIPENYADVAITSPPYNMNLRVRNGKYCSRQITKELTTKYSDYDDNLSIEEYYEFNRVVINELLRTSRLIFYNVQFLTGNKRPLFRLIGHFSDVIKEVVIWDKVNSQPAIRDGVMNSRYEVILVFEKDGAINRRFENANFDRGTLENLWQIKRGKKISKEHGAVFPEQLVHTILQNFTKEGDIIIDPFSGTGTTGAVCKKTGRNFIGFEISSEYCEMSKRRISELTNQITFFEVLK